ncbi:MAG: hypothetical protein J6386_07780 [Candidatus Synoicihabitans palmerolidicus]|nr:hypothetical protein [Candidatus Synoicihabitans palmerolidicus]
MPLYGFFYRLGTWLLQKIGVAVLYRGVVLVGVGVWLYAKDQVDSETRRLEYQLELEASRDAREVGKNEALARVTDLQLAVGRQEARVAQATKIIENLQALESWWDRLWGNPDQQEANAQQIKRMEALRQDSTLMIEDLSEKLQTAVREAEDIEFRLTSIKKEEGFDRQCAVRVGGFALCARRVEPLAGLPGGDIDSLFCGSFGGEGIVLLLVGPVVIARQSDPI